MRLNDFLMFRARNYIFKFRFMCWILYEAELRWVRSSLSVKHSKTTFQVCFNYTTLNNCWTSREKQILNFWSLRELVKSMAKPSFLEPSFVAAAKKHALALFTCGFHKSLMFLFFFKSGLVYYVIILKYVQWLAM